MGIRTKEIDIFKDTKTKVFLFDTALYLPYTSNLISSGSVALFFYTYCAYYLETDHFSYPIRQRVEVSVMPDPAALIELIRHFALGPEPNNGNVQLCGAALQFPHSSMEQTYYTLVCA